MDTTDCIATYELESHDSVLAERRRRDHRVDDWSEGFPAEAVDKETHSPVRTVDAFRLGGEPILWLRDDGTPVVTDAFAGGLEAVDATGLAQGETARVGQLSERALERMEPRRILEFLLRADVIRTYVHIGSTLCLLEERPEGRPDEPGAAPYVAHLRGEHVYYTQEKTVAPLEFSVVISEEGEITVSAPNDGNARLPGEGPAADLEPDSD